MYELKLNGNCIEVEYCGERVTTINIQCGKLKDCHVIRSEFLQRNNTPIITNVVIKEDVDE